MQRTAKARFQVEGMLPVMVSQIGVNRAGGVYFCWRGVGVVSCRMANAIRAAADWRSLAARNKE
jgi:hypothetical protein